MSAASGSSPTSCHSPFSDFGLVRGHAVPRARGTRAKQPQRAVSGTGGTSVVTALADSCFSADPVRGLRPSGSETDRLSSRRSHSRAIASCATLHSLAQRSSVAARSAVPPRGRRARRNCCALSVRAIVRSDSAARGDRRIAVHPVAPDREMLGHRTGLTHRRERPRVKELQIVRAQLRRVVRGACRPRGERIRCPHAGRAGARRWPASAAVAGRSSLRRLATSPPAPRREAGQRRGSVSSTLRRARRRSTGSGRRCDSSRAGDSPRRARRCRWSSSGAPTGRRRRPCPEDERRPPRRAPDVRARAARRHARGASARS